MLRERGLALSLRQMLLPSCYRNSNLNAATEGIAARGIIKIIYSQSKTVPVMNIHKVVLFGGALGDAQSFLSR